MRQQISQIVYQKQQNTRYRQKYSEIRTVEGRVSNFKEFLLKLRKKGRIKIGALQQPQVIKKCIFDQILIRVD